MRARHPTENKRLLLIRKWLNSGWQWVEWHTSLHGSDWSRINLSSHKKYINCQGQKCTIEHEPRAGALCRHKKQDRRALTFNNLQRKLGWAEILLLLLGLVSYKIGCHWNYTPNKHVLFTSSETCHSSRCYYNVWASNIIMASNGPLERRFLLHRVWVSSSSRVCRSHFQSRSSLVSCRIFVNILHSRVFLGVVWRNEMISEASLKDLSDNTWFALKVVLYLLNANVLRRHETTFFSFLWKRKTKRSKTKLNFHQFTPKFWLRLNSIELAAHCCMIDHDEEEEEEEEGARWRRRALIGRLDLHRILGALSQSQPGRTYCPLTTTGNFPSTPNVSLSLGD